MKWLDQLILIRFFHNRYVQRSIAMPAATPIFLTAIERCSAACRKTSAITFACRCVAIKWSSESAAFHTLKYTLQLGLSYWIIWQLAIFLGTFRIKNKEIKKHKIKTVLTSYSSYFLILFLSLKYEGVSFFSVCSFSFICLLALFRKSKQIFIAELQWATTSVS